LARSGTRTMLRHRDDGRHGMTDAERDEIDHKAKEIINGCTARITRLEERVKGK
jgi:hypothetical protein